MSTAAGRPGFDVGAYYDRFWSGADQTALARHDYRAFQADLFARVDGLLEPLAGRRLLEIGPGQGVDTLHFLRRGAEVWAVDLSATSLELVQRRAEEAGLESGLHTVRSSGERLAFADASFDLVYLRATLMHADWPRLTAECGRVLRPGGRAVFVEPLRHHPAVALYRATLSSCRDAQPRYLSWWDFRRFPPALRPVELRSFYFLSPLALALPGRILGPMLSRPLQALDRGLLRLSALRPFGWYVVACYEREAGKSR